MPSNKDFKRVVRARMDKTGEAYTTARAVLLLKRWVDTAPTGEPKKPVVASTVVAVPAVSAADFAKLAGMADEKIKAKTGCAWDRWVWALDRVNAHQWPHREIAKYVHEKYKVDDWWAQSVTVGYERIKGLREIGQRRSGHYEVNKSRTLQVSLTRLYRAFGQPMHRNRWLGDVTVAVRTSRPNKYIRLTWQDGTTVVVGFLSKARSKAQVSVQHGGLPSKEAAARMRAFWEERLEALEEMLATGGNGKR